MQAMLDALSLEELRAVSTALRRFRRQEEIQRLADIRVRGLRFQPNTCATCNKVTYLGPLCFDHMDPGRPMWRLWLDYMDRGRRDVRHDRDVPRRAVRQEARGGPAGPHAGGAD